MVHIARTRYIFYTLLILIFYGYTPSSAVTINGKDIHDVLKGNEAISYRDPETDNLFLSIKNGAITIGSLQLTDIETARMCYNNIKENHKNIRHDPVQDDLFFNSKASIEANEIFLLKRKNITFHACTTIKISKAILQSKKEIILAGKKCTLDNCFINTKRFALVADHPESIFQQIIFTFNKNVPVPWYARGEINFETDETTENFIVTGAKEICMVFKPHTLNT